MMDIVVHQTKCTSQSQQKIINLDTFCAEQFKQKQPKNIVQN